MHQHPLARLHQTATTEGHIGGQIGHRIAGRLAEAELGRLVTQGRGRQDGVLSKAAPAAADHRIAGREARDPSPQGVDLAGQLHAADKRDGRLVLVLAAGLHQVGEIHRRRANANPNLAGTGLRGRHVLDHATGIVRGKSLDDQGSHQGVSPSIWSRTRPAISRQAASAAGTTPVKAVKACDRLS